MDNLVNQSKPEEKKCGWSEERENVRVTMEFVFTFNFWSDGNVMRELLANHYYIIKIIRAPDKKIIFKASTLW